MNQSAHFSQQNPPETKSCFDSAESKEDSKGGYSFGRSAKRENVSFFLYARKSQESEERQQLSIPAQIEELRDFARKENIRLADVLTESKTAKSPGRPIFNDLLSRVENGEAQGILAWHPDRLARNAVDAGKIIHLLDTGKMLSLKFPTFWFQNTPQGLFMLNIAFGQSKYYVDNLSVNTKRGMRQKARMGVFPGWAPRGYLNDKNTRSIIVDEQTAPAIKEMFKRYSIGDYTLKRCAHFLATQGIKSRNGKVLKVDRIKHMLQNPFYYGYFIFKGELHEGTHGPIISKKLFDQVQQVLVERGYKVPQEAYNYPFAGLIKCGECGYMITAESHHKHYKKTNRKVTYVYYRCTKKSKIQSCFQLYTNEKKLIPQVNRIIRKVSLAKSEAQYFCERISKEEEQTKRARLAMRSKVEQKLTAVSLKLEKLLDAYLDQIVGKEAYHQKQNQLMSRKKTLMEKLATFDQRQNDWLEPFREWVETAESAAKIAKEGVDLHEKREFLLKIGSNLKLKDEELYWEEEENAQNPYLLLFQSSEGGQKQRAVPQHRPPSRNLVPLRGIEPRSPA